MSSKDKQSSSFRTAGVFTLSACHFIHDVYASFLAPMLPMLIQSLQLSLASAGFLGTVMQLPAFFNPVIGRFADRYGHKRRIISISLIITSVSMSLLGCSPNYASALLLAFITGVGTALFHVPTPVLVARHSGAHTGRGMSWFMTGGEFSRFVGPLIAVSLIGYMGLTGYYPVMVLGIVAAIWLLTLDIDDGGSNERNKNASLRAAWNENKVILKPLSGILITRGFMHAAMAMFLPTYITQTGGSILDGGIALAVVEGAGVVGIFLAGPFSDRFGRRLSLTISLVTAPFAMTGFILTSGIYRFPFMILTGFSLLSTTPVMLAMVQHHARQFPTVANGLFMMLSFMARSAILVVVGAFADRLGLDLTYQLCAAAGVLSWLFLMRLSKTD